MKTLSLTQPWASLVACGAKKIETRSWSTNYRGALAIHAAKGFPKEARQFSNEPVCYEAMRVQGNIPEAPFWLLMDEEPTYPRGFVLATCRLTACLPVTDVRDLSEQEKAFGDYTPGRWAWLLTEVQPLVKPIPAIGQLSLWEFEFPDGALSRRWPS